MSDGGGLVLEVMTSGTKIWRYRYSLHGKQQPLITVGDYPATGLMAARERARRYALEKDVYPALGNKPLSEVTPGDVLAICDRIKKRGAPKMIGRRRRSMELA